MNKYYVYEWYILETDEVFYVGKGCRRRAGNIVSRNKFFKDMYYSHKCKYRKVYNNLTEQQAYEKEIELIKFYRENTSYRLTNICDGGEGSDGKIFCKKVLQLNLDGEIIEKFDSITEAGEKTNTDLSCISKCCLNRSKYKSANGFIWVYEEEYLDKQHIYSNERDIGKPVLQFDLNGNFIREYNSIYEASKKTNILNHHIRNCCNNKTKTGCGYIWIFKSKYEPKYPLNYNNPKKPKSIIMKDLNDNILGEFDSINSANNFINPNKDNRKVIKYACEHNAIRLNHKWEYKI